MIRCTKGRHGHGFISKLNHNTHQSWSPLSESMRCILFIITFPRINLWASGQNKPRLYITSVINDQRWLVDAWTQWKVPIETQILRKNRLLCTNRLCLIAVFILISYKTHTNDRILCIYMIQFLCDVFCPINLWYINSMSARSLTDKAFKADWSAVQVLLKTHKDSIGEDCR